MISFLPSPEQQQVIDNARAFVSEHVVPAAQAYESIDDPLTRFQSLRECAMAAYKSGFIRDSVPVSLGGAGRSLVDTGIQWEEFGAIDPSICVTILANNLGFGPIVHGASPAQQAKWLAPFLRTDGPHPPAAALCFTEIGGVANWLDERGTYKTTIIQDGDEWVINGEKIWPNVSSGWDGEGAEVLCVVGKTSHDLPPKECMGCVVVTREEIDANKPGAFSVVREPEPPGLRAASGPHIKFTNLRVPISNMLAKPGKESIDLVVHSFLESGALVGAMSTGVMRTVFETTLDFAKKDARNGPFPIIGHQSVANLLCDAKAKIEASRALVWRGLDDLDNGRGTERALLAKIYASDRAIEVVTDCARVIGIGCFDQKFFNVTKWLNEALCMSLFDGGNVGVRRRQVQALFMSDEYTVTGSRGF